MGWDPFGDLSRAVENVTAPVTKAFDSAFSTNFSGNNSGGTLARISEDINKSDGARWAGGALTSTYRAAKTPLEVASDLSRGDIQNAGRNLGRGSGAITNVLTLNSAEVLRSNDAFLRNENVKKYTLGFSDDIAGFGSGMKTQEDSAYLSDADRNSTLRAGSKGLVAVAAAPYVAAGAQSAGSYIAAQASAAWGWLTGTATTAVAVDYLTGKAKDEGQKAIDNLVNGGGDSNGGDQGYAPGVGTPGAQRPLPFDGSYGNGGAGAVSGGSGSSTGSLPTGTILLCGLAFAAVYIYKKRGPK